MRTSRFFMLLAASIPVIMAFVPRATVNTKASNTANSIQAVSDSTTIDSVAIITTMGTITVMLYNETPLHKANFLKLVEQNYYDSVLFHRVIKGFMIQAGDPASKAAQPGAMYGSGGPGYTVPAEINSNLVHKRGALAAARTGDQVNPLKASSGSQFYICHVPTPFLDGQYTVFGQTIRGFDVIDKIANAPTLPGDRPVQDIKILHMKHLNKEGGKKKGAKAKSSHKPASKGANKSKPKAKGSH